MKGRAAADSEFREKEAGGAAGYEDVHGNADANVAAASEDGGGGSGEGCGGGASVVELGGSGRSKALQCHPAQALSIFLNDTVGSDFFQVYLNRTQEGPVAAHFIFRHLANFTMTANIKHYEHLPTSILCGTPPC